MFSNDTVYAMAFHHTDEFGGFGAVFGTALN